MLPLCNGGIPVPDVLVGLGQLLDGRSNETGIQTHGFHRSGVNMCWTESACLLSAEEQGHRLYQCTLLHLSVTLLHLLDGVFPLVDELPCLQMSLLQILCSLIQSDLLENHKTFSV